MGKEVDEASTGGRRMTATDELMKEERARRRKERRNKKIMNTAKMFVIDVFTYFLMFLGLVGLFVITMCFIGWTWAFFSLIFDYWSYVLRLALIIGIVFASFGAYLEMKR